MSKKLVFALVVVSIVLAACGTPGHKGAGYHNSLPTATLMSTATPDIKALDPNCARFVKTNAKFGLNLLTSEVGAVAAEVKPGQTVVAAHVSSDGSTGFQFCSYTPDGELPVFKNVSMTWSGGFTSSGADITIQAFNNATPGTYMAQIAILDLTTGALSEPLMLKIIILAPTAIQG